LKINSLKNFPFYNIIYLFTIAIFLLTNFSYAQKPYVLLVSYDAFRYDYLDRNITPTLSDFAENGVRALSFEPVFPSKTFPNHLSIITGMYADNHGIISNNIYNNANGRKYSLGNREEVQKSDWYLGEPFWVTAQRNGIKTASFYWPSSSVKDENYHPNIYKEFDRNVKFSTRIDSVVSWFNYPQKKRPHFVTLYFCLTDDYGHKFGPNSDSINWAINQMDLTTKYLLEEINKTDIKDSLNIIFVSDHGMTEISPEWTINVDDILNGLSYKTQNSGPVMFIDTKKENQQKIFDLLKKNENHYKAYKKSEIPEYFHYNKHPFISEIVLIADLGWSLIDKNSNKDYSNGEVRGNHGYDNRNIEMHGFFLAKGPAFKSGYKTGTIKNIDIYPLLCKIFNIEPRQNIDGDLERIGHILK